MQAGFRRFIAIAVALLVLALSAAPVVLRAAHHGHACAHAECAVCSAIRDDLAALRIIAAAVVAALAYGIALLRVHAANPLAARGFGSFPPVDLKVRMNN